jgi:hypothetical protein
MKEGRFELSKQTFILPNLFFVPAFTGVAAIG